MVSRPAAVVRRFHTVHRVPGAGGQPGGVGVAGERGAKCLGMLGVQVGLVVGAVEAEPDRTLARVTFRSSMNSVCTFWATSVLRPCPQYWRTSVDHQMHGVLQVRVGRWA